eukprot:Opistho-1_new@31911
MCSLVHEGGNRSDCGGNDHGEQGRRERAGAGELVLGRETESREALDLNLDSAVGVDSEAVHGAREREELAVRAVVNAVGADGAEANERVSVEVHLGLEEDGNRVVEHRAVGDERDDVRRKLGSRLGTGNAVEDNLVGNRLDASDGGGDLRAVVALRRGRGNEHLGTLDQVNNVVSVLVDHFLDNLADDGSVVGETAERSLDLASRGDDRRPRRIGALVAAKLVEAGVPESRTRSLGARGGARSGTLALRDDARDHCADLRAAREAQRSQANNCIADVGELLEDRLASIAAAVVVEAGTHGIAAILGHALRARADDRLELKSGAPCTLR